MKHIKLKDFTVGQTVYVVKTFQGAHKEPIVTIRIVESIGRKYVYLQYGDEFKEDENEEFALSSKDYNTNTYLCKSEEDVEKFIEKESLELWWYNVAARRKIYTLDQLKKVKEILEGPQM